MQSTCRLAIARVVLRPELKTRGAVQMLFLANGMPSLSLSITRRRPPISCRLAFLAARCHDVQLAP